MRPSVTALGLGVFNRISIDSSIDHEKISTAATSASEKRCEGTNRTHCAVVFDGECCLRGACIEQDRKIDATERFFYRDEAFFIFLSH